MLAGRDCAYPPSDAELAAAWAAGVRVWGVYFAGPNVLYGWSDADILRVKAHGFVVIAFCSGYSDAAACGARARSLGVFVCLDDESGMRPDGSWVEAWCATAGAGLYGNGSFHYSATGIRRAAFHIFAGYYGYNPGATWPSFDVRPPTPCAWQWAGSHTEFGGNVDSAWYDDSFAGSFAGDSAHNTEEGMTPELAKIFIRVAYFVARDDDPTLDEFNAALAKAQVSDQACGDEFVTITESAEGKAFRAKLKAVLAAGPAQPDNDPAPMPGPEGPAGKDGAPGAPGVSPDPAAITNNVLQRFIDALAHALGLK